MLTLFEFTGFEMGAYYELIYSRCMSKTRHQLDVLFFYTSSTRGSLNDKINNIPDLPKVLEPATKDSKQTGKEPKSY